MSGPELTNSLRLKTFSYHDHFLKFQSAVYGSAVYIERSIYFFAGASSPFPNHRIDMTSNEEIQEVVRIGNHSSQYNKNSASAEDSISPSISLLITPHSMNLSTGIEYKI